VSKPSTLECSSVFAEIESGDAEEINGGFYWPGGVGVYGNYYSNYPSVNPYYAIQAQPLTTYTYSYLQSYSSYGGSSYDYLYALQNYINPYLYW
jgi:hypothetical protein